MFKKFTFVTVMFCLASFAFCENKTGVVINIKETDALGFIIKYIFIDSNNDKIIDSVIYLLGGGDSREYFEDRIEALILSEYIKIGSRIVFSFDNTKILKGIFVDYEGQGESIISIDGVAKNRLFPLRN
jgi:hypothetical protein